MVTAHNPRVRQGVIFDFNGVLLWDTPLHNDAWKMFSEKLRGRSMTNHEMELHMHGKSNKDILEYVLGRTVEGEELERLTKDKETVYRLRCLSLGSEFQLSPGAAELLNELVTRNIPMTIATSSEIGNVTFFFKELSLSRWFSIDNIVYDDGSFKSKPLPDIYVRASQKLGLAPQDCLVIEDARSGVQSATAANIGTIVLLGSPRWANEVSPELRIDARIKTVDEILHLNVLP